MDKSSGNRSIHDWLTVNVIISWVATGMLWVLAPDLLKDTDFATIFAAICLVGFGIAVQLIMLFGFNETTSVYLFIAAAAVFLSLVMLAAIKSRQPTFVGLAGMLVITCVGASRFLLKMWPENGFPWSP